jgi:hypothetical protein
VLRLLRQPDPERTIARYLLGELDEVERARVEERLFVEDGFEDEVRAARDELLQA